MTNNATTIKKKTFVHITHRCRPIFWWYGRKHETQNPMPHFGFKLIESNVIKTKWHPLRLSSARKTSPLPPRPIFATMTSLVNAERWPLVHFCLTHSSLIVLRNEKNLPLYLRTARRHLLILCMSFWRALPV